MRFGQTDGDPNAPPFEPIIGKEKSSCNRNTVDGWFGKISGAIYYLQKSLQMIKYD